ncbi:SMEK domain-containing protein [Enterobacter cloacae subsp. cloacae]|uniref:SMEK domain-containing protein n=1 Tax=Enterobacter cloacae TaxID=550 RepID=UPI00197EDA02|nr:SMEK domain-containing protein [Enterobacter cloacae]MBN4757959.1 SMEK domain-containing protein [Enterobacter cloacae]WLD33955.1 SMEK domain-containing protein [Enterobacter cloacae subsp. cloacae]HDC4682858.1 SMEK domain-containing protein [Enterobacter cloacae]HEC5279364.1 SMEK domain-containing protein [Enterobacter cloacae]
MNRVYYQNRIIKLLSWLRAEVELNNSLSLTDINKGAEDFYCGLLNIAYGYKLKNINIVEPNTAAIDLGDIEKRIAIQVTSVAALSKAKYTVEKFIEKRLYESFDKLYILNIVKKKNYATSSIGGPEYFLNPKIDIIDVEDLIKKINSDPDLSKLRAISEFLEAEIQPLGQRPLVKEEKFNEQVCGLGTKIVRVEQLLAEVIAQNARSEGLLSHEAILALARKLRPDELLNFAQAKQELELAVCAAQDLIRKGGTSYYQDRFVDDTHDSVNLSIVEGRLDQGSDAIDQALARLDQREALERENAIRQRTKLLKLSINYGVIAHDPERTADAEEKLLKIQSPDISCTSEEYQNRLAYYYHQGETQGVNFFLDVVIAMVSKRIEHSVEVHERIAALNWLGKSLGRIGERSPANETLKRAEKIFRDASKKSLEASLFSDWAVSQNGLANILQVQGRREHSNDNFYEAIHIYREILTIFVESNCTQQIAEINANLGAVLLAVGEGEGNTALLYEAMQTLKQALQGSILIKTPLVWAMAQNNLGNTLRLIGEREGKQEFLQAAVTALRAALLKRTHENAPFLVATTQNDLGNALLAIGERGANTVVVREAICHYEASLAVRTRDFAPLEWAATQHNLGTACLRVGEIDNDIQMLNQAKEAFDLALQERTPQRVPLRWANTMNSLGNVFIALGQHKNNPKQLLKAKQAYEAGLEELSPDLTPWDWALMKHNLGNAFQALAKYEDGTDSLHAAVGAYQESLKVRTFDRGRVAWATTKFSLGNTFLLIGQHERGTKYLKRAIQEYLFALPELGFPLREQAENRIGLIQEILQELGSEK